MNALVLEHPGRIATHAAAEASGPGPGEALVRVHRVGVCGTDLHAFRGRQPFFTYPRILGHELGVEVLAVGPGVDHVAPGDGAAVEPYLNCGHCIACRRGRPNCCAWMQIIGVHADGGMRRQLVVPAAKLHVSRSLSYDQLALVEPLATGAHAVERAGLEPEETVAVVGAGPVGLAVIQFALTAGCRVIVIDINSRRLAFCRDTFGLADEDLVNAGRIDVLDRLTELTGGDLPTAVFDVTGNAASMAASFTYPAYGGRLAFVGLFSGNVSFHDPSFHRRALTLFASRNALPENFRQVLRLLERGEIDTTAWITHRATLAEAPDCFEEWTRPETGVLKAMIHVT